MQSDLERIFFDEPTIQRRLDKIAAANLERLSRSRSDGDRHLELEFDFHSGLVAAGPASVEEHYPSLRFAQ
jgi:hypothetical protein